MITALLGLATLASPHLVVSADACPDAAAIESNLRSAGNELMGHAITEASVLLTEGALEIEAWGADGALLGRKLVPAPASCEHRAALVANLLETWSLSLSGLAFAPLEPFVPVATATATVSIARLRQQVAPEPYLLREPQRRPIDAAPWIVLGLGAALLTTGIALNTIDEPYTRTGEFLPVALYVSGSVSMVGALLALTAR